MDCRAKKAANFFVGCDLNPDTRVKIHDAMRIKGYSLSEAADRSLQMHVRREVDKITGENIPGPSAHAAAAASALLTLLTTANVGRPALRTITTVPAVGAALENCKLGTLKKLFLVPRTQPTKNKSGASGPSQ